MSDLFHQDVPDGVHPSGVRGRCGKAEARKHTYQMLTKRSQRMASFMSRLAWRTLDHRGSSRGSLGLAGVPLGDGVDLDVGGEAIAERLARHVIESDRYAFRADHLRATPAAVRFLSCEPLLGPLPSLDLTGIDWVIAGAESGHGARPMDMDWVRDLRDRCIALGTKFFLKQAATPAGRKVKLPELDGEQWVQMPERRAVAS
jgi:protein gp37